MKCYTNLHHDVITGRCFLSFINPTLYYIIAHLHHVLKGTKTHNHSEHELRHRNVTMLLQSTLNQEVVLTREETRAELDTLGTLSTMACFMYRSMACSMVV